MRANRLSIGIIFPLIAFLVVQMLTGCDRTNPDYWIQKGHDEAFGALLRLRYEKELRKVQTTPYLEERIRNFNERRVRLEDFSCLFVDGLGNARDVNNELKLEKVTKGLNETKCREAQIVVDYFLDTQEAQDLQRQYGPMKIDLSDSVGEDIPIEFKKYWPVGFAHCEISWVVRDSNGRAKRKKDGSIEIDGIGIRDRIHYELATNFLSEVTNRTGKQRDRIIPIEVCKALHEFANDTISVQDAKLLADETAYEKNNWTRVLSSIKKARRSAASAPDGK